jgi:hypothetical protein
VASCRAVWAGSVVRDQRGFAENLPAISPDRSSLAILDVELALKDLCRIVMPLPLEERGCLRICLHHLLPGRVQTIWEVKATSAGDDGVDELTGHGFHPVVGVAGARLVEEHHESEHLLVGITQEGILIFQKIADRHVEELAIVVGDDRARPIEKRRDAAVRNEVFVEDIGSIGVVLLVVPRSFVQQLIARDVLTVAGCTGRSNRRPSSAAGIRPWMRSADGRAASRGN